jgi:Sulfotransferase domain
MFQTIDRFIALRTQPVKQGVVSPEQSPLLFLGGLSRTGNHLVHALLDGHREIKAVPDEDYFLRTNVGSVVNRMKLLCSSGSGRLNIFIGQNKGNNWKKLTECKKDQIGMGYHKVDFPTIDYERFETQLKELSAEKTLSLVQIYQRYIDCVLGAVPDGDSSKDPSWKLYFTANADFLSKSILGWDARNKIIIPVRDPLQRFASHKNGDRQDFICTSERIAGWIKVHMSYESLAKKYEGRILFIDYSELINDVEKVMKRAACFMDIKYDEVFTYPTVLGKRVMGNSSFAGEGERSGGLYKGSLDKYLEILSNKEIDIIKNELSPIYSRFISTNIG